MWFLLPIFLTVGLAVWLYLLSPRQYAIRATYAPPPLTVTLTQPAGKSLNAVELWEMAINELSIGTQFIAGKVRENSREMMALMPALIGALTADSSSEMKSMSSRRLRSYRRGVIKYILIYLSMDQVSRPGKKLDAIEFSYLGRNKELGKNLVDFYAGQLLPSWKTELEKKKARIETRISRLAERLDSEQSKATKQRKLEYELIRQNYQFMLSLLENSISITQVQELPRELSDRIAAQTFYFLILSILVMLILILAAEFLGRTFTTESQVSNYLNIRLIGTLSEIEPLLHKPS